MTNAERVIKGISDDLYNIGEFLYEIEKMTRPELREFMNKIKEINQKAEIYKYL